MLVPLETLEGWPDVETPSVVEQLSLFIGIPLVATILIAIYVVLTRKRESRLAAESGVVEPAWLGGGNTDGPVLESGVESATSNKTAALRAGPTPRRAETEDEPTGGASARW